MIIDRFYDKLVKIQYIILELREDFDEFKLSKEYNKNLDNIKEEIQKIEENLDNIEDLNNSLKDSVELIIERLIKKIIIDYANSRN